MNPLLYGGTYSLLSFTYSLLFGYWPWRQRIFFPCRKRSSVLSRSSLFALEKDCCKMICVFPSRSVAGSAAKALRDLPESFTKRQFVEMYCKSMYIRQNQRLLIRFYFGHDVPREMFFDDEDLKQKFKERGMEFCLDQIQALSTICIGWLLGTFMWTFNYKHYFNLMKTNDRFANHPVAFYKRAIKNYY